MSMFFLYLGYKFRNSSYHLTANLFIFCFFVFILHFTMLHICLYVFLEIDYYNYYYLFLSISLLPSFFPIFFFLKFHCVLTLPFGSWSCLLKVRKEPSQHAPQALTLLTGLIQRKVKGMLCDVPILHWFTVQE